MMDPATGEILALASVPTFDPNRAAAATAAQWRNRAIADTYEPGSTFKAILAAAALESGVVRAEDRIFCENGSYAVGRRVVHDHDAYGWLTVTDVVRHSSNIGSAKVGERLGSERFGAFLDAFGFGRPTAVDLPGEVSGLVRPSAKWGRIHLVTTSFGQGISVTPLQLVRAYAAIANGGRLLRPYVVRRVLGPDGTVIQRNAPRSTASRFPRHRPGRAHHAARRGRERNGHEGGDRGHTVAGKTGTAQKVDRKTGRYSARDRMSSFIGFAPADAPRFVMLVVIDSPRTATYGGIVAARCFAASRNMLSIGSACGSRPPPCRTSSACPPAPNSSSGPCPPPNGACRAFWTQPAGCARAGRTCRLGRGNARSGFVTAQDPPPGAETSPGARLVLHLGTDVGATDRRGRDRVRGG